MTTRLVPSESATIQAAIDYFAGLGSLVGTGENKILVSAGTYTEDLSGAGLTTDATGYVTIEKSGAGEVLIVTTTGINLNNAGTYNGLRSCHAQASATMASGVNVVNAAGHTFFESGEISNPNARDVNGFRGGSGVTSGARIDDSILHGFSTLYKAAISATDGNAKRCTVYNSRRGIASGTATDCVVVGSTDYDFGATATKLNCASSDTTADGTSCIINIVAATEFVDAAGGDYTLDGASQLIDAGSTGNNIGVDQTTTGATTLTADSITAAPIYAGTTVTIDLSNATNAAGKTLSIPQGALTATAQDIN